jgi:Bacterial Ig-like domain
MNKINFKSFLETKKIVSTFVFLALLSVVWGITSAQNTLSTTESIILAPSDFLVNGSPTVNYVYLKWVDNATNEDKFYIERKLSSSTTWSTHAQINQPNAITYIDSSSISPGATYDYRIQACSSIYGCSGYAVLEGVIIPSSATSNQVPIPTSTTIPAMPTELSYGSGSSPITTSSVPLTWVDNATNEDGYKIGRKLSSSTTWSTLVQISEPNIISYIDNSVTSGATYDYRVQACLSNVGCSDYAVILKVTVPSSTTSSGGGGGDTTTNTSTAPIAPSSLALYTTLSTTSTSIPLKWKDNSTNEDKFRIERKTRDVSTSTFGLVSTVNGSSNTIASYNDNSVTVGTHYDYRVKACVGDLCSGYTYLENVYIPVPVVDNTTTDTTTDATTTDTTVTTTDALVNTSTTPIAPTSLILYAPLSTTSTTIPLKWKDNSTNEDKFRIERKVSSTTAWAILHEVSANTTGYIDNNSVTAGTHYDYRMKACTKDLCSLYIYLVEVYIPKTTVITTTDKIDTTNTLPPPSASTTTTVDTLPIAPVTITTDTPPPLPPPEPIITTTNTPPPVVSSNDTREVTQVLSETTGDDKKISDSEVDNLLNKDTNNDGVSDYDSIYVYKLDPVLPSPVSTYQGKTINAQEKILLNFDPTKSELTKVTPEQPIESKAPIVTAYKVKEIKLTDKKEIIITGQALPNSFITLYIYSTPIMVVVKTDSNGQWQYVLDKELEDGDHSVYTATVNNSGNIVAKSSGYLFTKTAQAVTLNNLPIIDASVNNDKPGLLEGVNLYIFLALILATSIIALILIGAISRKNNPN